MAAWNNSFGGYLSYSAGCNQPFSTGALRKALVAWRLIVCVCNLEWVHDTLESDIKFWYPIWRVFEGYGSGTIVAAAMQFQSGLKTLTQ